MDLPAAPLLLLVFLHPLARYLFFVFFFFLFLRPRRLGAFSPSFRDVFLALRLAASLFPTSAERTLGSGSTPRIQ